jgi:diketogulonate reductase-like aldo/keto reductase
LHPQNHGYDEALLSFQRSLRNLNTNYIDLFLLHYPECSPNICALMPKGTIHSLFFFTRLRFFIPSPLSLSPIVEYCSADDNKMTLISTHTILFIICIYIEKNLWKKSWKALEMLYKTKKVRAIGVSNFNLQQLKTLLVRVHIL